jgi:integrase
MSIKRVFRKRPEPGWYYVYDLYIGGRRVRTPRGEAFPTKEECRDAVSSIRTDWRRGKYQFPAERSHETLGELARTWEVRLVQLGRSAGYIARMKQSLGRLDALLPPGAGVIDIKARDLERFFSSRIQAGAKLSTIYAEMVTVMTALNNAGTLFEALAEWRPPRKPKACVQDVEGRQRLITRDEEQGIITALLRTWGRSSAFDRRARTQAARIFWLALRTGMREGEIFGLMKSSVSFDRAIKMEHGWIEVRRSRSQEHTKTKKTRVIPMSATVARLIKQRMAETDSRYVFPSVQDELRPIAALYSVFKQACESAGVLYGWKTPGGLVFHDTRHTAATRMLQAGTDLKTVGNILGHSDQYMTMRYAHATAESRQAAVRSLEDDDFCRFESVAEPTEPLETTPDLETSAG